MWRKTKPSSLRPEVYEKYIKPIKDNEKKQKILKRKEWWSNNLFNVISTVIAIAALVVSIISILI